MMAGQFDWPAMGRNTLSGVRRWMVRLVVVVATCVGSSIVFAVDNPVVTSPAACCAAAERITPPPPPSSRVFIIGDSLTWGLTSSSVLGSSGTIQARLRGTGRVVDTNAEIGRSTWWGRQAIRSQRSTVAAADVILLGFGTNEVLDVPGLSVGQSRLEIDRMIEAVRAINPAARIVWSDVSVERLASRTANWNRALVDAAVTQAEVEVCEWRLETLNNPQWFAGDGVHLTTAGYSARREILIQCVIVG